MRAGRLRHLVDLQQPTAASVPDDHGVLTETFATVAQVWASIEAVAGREGLSDKKVLAQSTHEIRMRDVPTLTAAWQVVYHTKAGDRIFRIVDLRRPSERSIELILFADEQVL